MGRISVYRIACCQSPAVFAVAFVSFRVSHAVFVVAEGMVSHHIPVVGIRVAQVLGGETDIGILCPEQRTAGLFGAIVLQFERIAVGLGITLDASAPCPSLVIAVCRDRMGG